MVYTGPSEGCHLCRKRRIKCDGGRPQCQRCIIYKAKCPGYRTESDFKFVSENNSTNPKTNTVSRKRSSHPKTPVTALSSSPKSSPSSSVTSESFHRSNSSSSSKWVANPRRPASDSMMPRGPLSAWEDWSITSFIHDWTIPEASDGFAVGFLEFLPDLFTKTAAEVDFSLALRAASFASFANQHNSPEMMAKARSSYGRALTALNASLRNPLEATKDHTIASIVLLQIFENITCDDSLSIGTHDAGLRMLLNMRGDKQLESAQGRSIARIIMGYLHARDVNQKRESSDIMRRGCHHLGYPPEHPARQRGPNVRGVTDFLAEITPIFQQDPTDPQVIAEGVRLLQGSIEFDDTYRNWEAALPPKWHRREVQVPFDPLRSSATTIPHTGIVHMYSTPLIACYVNLYRIQFIVMHKIILRLADRLRITDWSIPATADAPALILNTTTSLATIHRFNDETLASAACAMAEVNPDGSIAHMSAGRAVGAYYLLWPLTHVQQDINSTPEQVADATRALSFIGNVLGVKRGVKQINSPPMSSAAAFQKSQSPPQQTQIVVRRPAIESRS